MLRIQVIANAAHAESYYAKSDGGYYLQQDDLRSEWLGKGAAMLGLHGPPDYEHFRRLIHGLDPKSGEQLTAKLIDGRVPGWDISVHCPKKMTIAIEGGDERLQEALWEATRETIADLERDVATRVRVGRKQEDRVTGNLVCYAVEHAETRPVKEDRMSDPHRHLHVVCVNGTWDQIEQKWKAAKVNSIMENRKYFDRRFNQRLSSKVAALGYGIETKWERTAKGTRRYMGWDIKGVPDSAAKKFSRRSAEIDKLAETLGITSTVAKDRLGATSRLEKRDDLTLAECRQYWDSRLTQGEKQEISDSIERAKQGGGAKVESLAEAASRYARDHHFYSHAVVPVKTLEITAMERSMGTCLPEDIERAVQEQGLLVRHGQATTEEALARERRIIEFARHGRGTCRPLGDVNAKVSALPERLSKDQKAALEHLWKSTDRCIVVEGDAGAGKTSMLTVAIPGISKPGVFLAPSTTASRGELRTAGFENADTIARFLVDKKFQEQARDGYIYIDEAPMASLKDIDQVVAKAQDLNARVIFQGDRKQHTNPQPGNLFPVLERYAGVPIARLTEVFRQKDPRYKQAVVTIAKGDVVGGFDRLAEMGWVKQTPVFDHNRPLVEDYLSAISTKKANGKMVTAIVVAPTNREVDEISQEIRRAMKERKLLAKEDVTFAALRPLHWSDAERADLDNYMGTEIIRFHQNSGPFKAGQRVTADQLRRHDYQVRPEHFTVYAPAEINLAIGDTVRITGNGKSKDGKHKVDNGRMYTIDGFTETGDIRLSNSWVLEKSFGLLSHGYATTSFQSQSRNVDCALVAMGSESEPAINAQMLYVATSRGRERCTIYSDISRASLREAIQRVDTRKSATELMEEVRPAAGWREKASTFMRTVQDRYRQLQEKSRQAMAQLMPQREPSYVR